VSDWRFVGGVVVAVAMLAVVLGIFVGLPLVLTHAGIHVDWGFLVNLLTAVGTVGAAVAAVGIATVDRWDRKRERDDADEAQAALVIAQPYRVPTVRSEGAFQIISRYPELGVLVKNYGTLSVLRVTVKLAVDGHPNLDLHPSADSAADHPVVAPVPDNPFGQKFIFRAASDEQLEDPTITDKTLLTATVRFQDARGNRWETIFKARAVLETPRIPRRSRSRRRVWARYSLPSSRRMCSPSMTSGSRDSSRNVFVSDHAIFGCGSRPRL
jgi:hypothetical protein